MIEYTTIDQQLHQLSQVLAKANRTFVAPLEDDSHTNLAFDSLGNRILGHWIGTPYGDIIFTLNLHNQTFEWVNRSQKVVQCIQIINRTIKDVELEIASRLPELGLLSDGFTDEMHYKIPEYTFMNKVVPKFSDDDLLEWTNFRLLANEACCALLTNLGVDGDIRIWPHHFDTGIFVRVNENLGLGFGLAMEDLMAGDPYLYMTGYPVNGSLDYMSATPLPFGRWEISQYWNGAILPLTELLEVPQAGSQFMISAVRWFLDSSHS
jgi:hypothetical protein